MKVEDMCTTGSSITLQYFQFDSDKKITGDANKQHQATVTSINGHCVPDFVSYKYVPLY